MVRSFFTIRWLITTLLVIAAVGVMSQLGFWQLDRLEQRRASNARVQAQIDSPPLDLNQALSSGQVDLLSLTSMEYRSVVLRGIYKPEEQVILRNQVWENQPGSHLLTPLYLEDTPYVVLVDRGWIPLEAKDPEDWEIYQQPGRIEVRGIIQPGQDARRFGMIDPTLTPGQERLAAWNAVRLKRIASQISGDLLPVYVQAGTLAAQGSAAGLDGAQPEDAVGPPYPALEMPDLSEGSHMGYALQWFAFAAILGVGYPFFVRKQLQEGGSRAPGQANRRVD